MIKTFLHLSGCAVLAMVAMPRPAAATDWPMFGDSTLNLSDNPSENLINKLTVVQLKPKWVATTSGDVSARAAVVNGVAYFPDWGGNIWAVNVNTGQTIWHNTLASYGFLPGTISRTSPAVEGGTVYIGTQKSAYLVAIDAATGKQKWGTQLDSHPVALLTGRRSSVTV